VERLLRHILETMAAAAERLSEAALMERGWRAVRRQSPRILNTVLIVCRMPRAVKRCISGERSDCPSADGLQFPFLLLEANFGPKRPIPVATAIRLI
jgi:hypothetical protein